LLQNTKTPLNIALVILFVAVMPAIFEEIAFRGIILNSLKNTGFWFSLIVSGVLFSFFHMSPAQTIFQFLVGVIYSYIILSGGSLILTISMHFINNLYIVLNYYYFGFTLTGTIKIIVMIIALLMLFVGIVLFYKKQGVKNSKEVAKQNRIIFIMSAVLGFAVALVMWIQGLL
jgi:membrane protease YdiL (CAAX protease family)